MNAVQLTDEDLSIHIVKKPLGKRKKDMMMKQEGQVDKPAASKSRKRKRTKGLPVDADGVNSSSEVVADRVEEPPERTASFRHLFSFADVNDADASIVPKTKVGVHEEPFSLFQAGFQPDASVEEAELGPVHEISPSEERDHVDVDNGFRNTGAQRTATMVDEGAKMAIDAMELHNAPEASMAASAALREPYLEHRENRSSHVHSPSPRFDSAASRLGRDKKQPVAVVEELDTSPAAILAMAQNFCRKQSMEELEAEWCAANGIREQMRRDFKLKRRNSIRDRKLGSTAHKP